MFHLLESNWSAKTRNSFQIQREIVETQNDVVVVTGTDPSHVY